jgi:thiamine pyrophosphate-dependent acetolactate synthase large subunit-like protein
MKNNTLGQIKWEQLMFLGNPEYECALQPIDFATVAEGFGIKGIRANSDKDISSGLDALFAAPGPALLEALVDPMNRCYAAQTHAEIRGEPREGAEARHARRR